MTFAVRIRRILPGRSIAAHEYGVCMYKLERKAEAHDTAHYRAPKFRSGSRVHDAHGTGTIRSDTFLPALCDPQWVWVSCDGRGMKAERRAKPRAAAQGYHGEAAR